MAVTLGQLHWETVRKSNGRVLKSEEERSSGLRKQEIIRLSKDDLLCSPQLHLHLNRHRVSVGDTGGFQLITSRVRAEESNHDANAIFRLEKRFQMDRFGCWVWPSWHRTGASMSRCVVWAACRFQQFLLTFSSWILHGQSASSHLHTTAHKSTAEVKVHSKALRSEKVADAEWRKVEKSTALLYTCKAMQLKLR